MLHECLPNKCVRDAVLRHQLFPGRMAGGGTQPIALPHSWPSPLKTAEGVIINVSQPMTCTQVRGMFKRTLSGQEGPLKAVSEEGCRAPSGVLGACGSWGDLWGPQLLPHAAAQMPNGFVANHVLCFPELRLH